MSPVRHSSQLRDLLRWRRTLSGANLRQRAWEDGVLGGDRRWIAIGGFAWFVWALQWAWRRDSEVVYRTKVKPGESVTISTSKPLPKKQAKKQAQEQKAAAKVARKRPAKQKQTATQKAGDAS